MYRDMLGINPDISNPGFKNIILKPTPCRVEDLSEDLHKVSGTYNTAYGMLSVTSDISSNS